MASASRLFTASDPIAAMGTNDMGTQLSYLFGQSIQLGGEIPPVPAQGLDLVDQFGRHVPRQARRHRKTAPDLD